jgi:hypothetical protein
VRHARPLVALHAATGAGAVGGAIYALAGASVAASGTLLAWIGAQVAVIGLRSPLQPLMAAVAVTGGVLALDDGIPAGHRT